jgi:hypothetical protein
MRNHLRTHHDSVVRLIVRSRNPSECRGCLAPIDWFQTIAGKSMPMNAGAIPERTDGGIGFFHTSDSHWASCPQRSLFSGVKNRT